jgi:hypothetical protein
MDMQALLGASLGRSRRSLFRDLAQLGYFSSYTHAGRFYTLVDIPVFDQYGLWRYEAIGFSQRGTLRDTLAWRVEQAEAGSTHAELQALLRLQVHNTLLGLVRAGVIRREQVAGIYLYVSSHDERATPQLDARRKLVAEAERPPRLPPVEVVLLVLVEALHASEGLPAAPVVAARLAARREGIAPEDVERVYSHFGLEPGKKTAQPH